MAALAVALAKLLVSRPEAVSVTPVPEGRDTILELRVAPEDVGRVIGRQGRTIRSLRALVAAAGRDPDRRQQLELVETPPATDAVPERG